MQVRAVELPQELIPSTADWLHVSAVPVEYDNVAEAGAHHAVDHVAQHREERPGPERQRAGMSHVMLADTAHQPLGNEHARGQSLGRGAGHQPNAAPVVLQMFRQLFIINFIPEVAPVGFDSVEAIVHLGNNCCQHFSLCPGQL